MRNPGNKVSRKYGALTICMENQEISGRIQMEWFIPVGIFRKKSNTLSAYHFARKFRWKILSNGTGIFLGTENRNGIQLYHLQNTGKVSAFSGHEA